jgi:hypothetical protein
MLDEDGTAKSPQLQLPREYPMSDDHFRITADFAEVLEANCLQVSWGAKKNMKTHAEMALLREYMQSNNSEGNAPTVTVNKSSLQEPVANYKQQDGICWT